MLQAAVDSNPAFITIRNVVFAMRQVQEAIDKQQFNQMDDFWTIGDILFKPIERYLVTELSRTGNCAVDQLSLTNELY